MPTHQSFSAWIVCEGKTLREFEVTVDPITNKVSCWIPCEIGKTFAVHWMDHGSNVDSAAYINLDGFTVPGRFLYGLGAAERDSVRVSDCLERPFQFAVSKAGQGSISDHAPEVGTISLKIKQIQRVAPNHPANAPLSPPRSARANRKGSSEACVGFGPKRAAFVQHNKTWSFVPYDKSHPGAFVQFVFRYRTREFLLSQGIIHEADLAEQERELIFVHEFASSDAYSSLTASSTMFNSPLPPLMPPFSPKLTTIDPSILMRPVLDQLLPNVP